MSACKVPPDGWTCSRTAGHGGPCAATPETELDLAQRLLGEVERLRTDRDRYRNDYFEREQELQDLRSYKRSAEDKREWAQGKYDEQIRSNLELIRERDAMKAEVERLNELVERGYLEHMFREHGDVR